jgi:hypothetical protein
VEREHAARAHPADLMTPASRPARADAVSAVHEQAGASYCATRVSRDTANLDGESGVRGGDNGHEESAANESQARERLSKRRLRSRPRAEERRSPDALRRRNARTWLTAVLIGLGLALVVGYLLPIDQSRETASAPSTDRRR